jgi:hypothetical protein
MIKEKRKRKRKRKIIFLNKKHKKKGQFIWAARSPNRLPFADNLVKCMAVHLGWQPKWTPFTNCLGSNYIDHTTLFIFFL